MKVYYQDANVSAQVSFNSNWALSDWDTPTIDNDADHMHNTVVAEISERLLAGEKFEIAVFD